MRKYLAVLKAAIQKFITYRIAFLLPIFSTLMRFVMLYYLWRAAFAEREEALGYTFDSIFSYYLFVAVSEVIVNSNMGSRISNEIKTGALSSDLLRPYSYLLRSAFEELGGKLIYILYSIAGIGLLFIIFYNMAKIQFSYLNISYFLLFCIFGYIINLLLGLILGSLSFWMVHTGGFYSFINQPISFLSGTYFPVDMLKFSFLTMTPFVFSRFVPAKVIIGEIGFDQVIFYIFLGLFWITVLYSIFSIVWRFGLKRYESIGT